MRKKVICAVILLAVMLLCTACGGKFSEDKVAEYVSAILEKDEKDISNDDISQIDTLYLSEITTLKDLKKFTGLTALSVSDSEISKWDYIYPLKLNTLELWNNDGIVDISKLDLSELTSFTVMGDMQNISALADAPNLSALTVWNNGSTDFSFLKDIDSLTYLEIVNSNLTDISFVKNMNNLTYLSLSGNMIEDISPLENKMGISYLDLHHNKINDISPLYNIIDLQELDLSENAIKDISPLENLTGLVSVNLSNNNIQDISPMSSLRFLAYADISANRITSVAPLADIESLQELSAAKNAITDVPVNMLKNMYFMDLSANRITIKNAKFFLMLDSNKHEGASINLFDNPFSKSEIYELEKSKSTVFLSNGLPVSAEGVAEYNRIIDGICADVKDKSDMEKVISVYNYLCRNSESVEPETVDSSLGGFNVVVNKKGTGLDFAEAFSSILNRMGIKSDIYKGDKFNRSETDIPHYWNIVTVGEKRAYFDVYCAAAAGDYARFFGLNDEQMSEREHIMLDAYRGSITDTMEYIES